MKNRVVEMCTSFLFRSVATVSRVIDSYNSVPDVVAPIGVEGLKEWKSSEPTPQEQEVGLL